MAERRLRSINIVVAENGYSVTEDRAPREDKKGMPIWEPDTPRVYNDVEALLVYVRKCLASGNKSGGKSKKKTGWQNADGSEAYA